MKQVPEGAFLRSRSFDALLVTVIFFSFALAYDFVLDDTLTVRSIMAGLSLSLVVGFLLGFRKRFETPSSETLRQRSETFEVVGKIAIGLLLFGVLSILLLTHG